MKNKIVSFIVPTLNEEQNIKDTVDTIERNIPYGKLDYEIVIVDGGSTDRTVEISLSLSSINKKITVYNDGGIKGFGHAYKKGVFLSKGDYIILIPGDNEISGEAIQAILKEIGQADMIIPYFTNQQLRKKSRRIISRTFVMVLNKIAGLNLHYYNGTVLYRQETLKGYNIRTTGFAYQAETLINLIKAGFTYKEVATRLQRRSSGKTKIFKLKNIISVVFFLAWIVWIYRVSNLFKKEVFGGSTKALSHKRVNLLLKKKLPRIIVPDEINYIAVFLSLSCNLSCSYCINNYESRILKKGIMNGESWVKGLNRLELRHNLPITLQGGEPTLHKNIYYIIDNLRSDIEIDILTNLEFDIDEFIERVDPKRINRDPRYHSIRGSYHPGFMDIDNTIEKVVKLRKAGFNICLSAVDHPNDKKAIHEAWDKSNKAGIIFSKKEFLGFYHGKPYGYYKYPEAVMCQFKRNVYCRTTELLIGTMGAVHKCTRDIYIDSNPIGNILDPDFKSDYIYRYCENYGYCNPCDIKIKTNRFLKEGHTAVDIKFME